MKKKKSVIIVVLLVGLFGKALAQFVPPPPPPHRRHRQSTESNSQEPLHPTGYFEVSIGLLQPVGNFASTVGAAYNGYALPGTALNISLGIPVNHTNIGVALMYGNFTNAFDINSYVNNIQISDQSKQYSPENQDYYIENYVLGGLFWTWPVNRLSFDARIMGGFAFCNLPDVSYEGVQYDPVFAQNDYYDWETYSSSSTSFAYDFGADIRYKLRRYSIMLGVDFTHANPMVNTTQAYEDPNGIYSYSHVSGNLPISTVSFNLGIAYQINPR